MNFEAFLNKFQKRRVDHYSHRVSEGKMISVCVQTYQHVNFIRQCLDGILLQETSYPFEVLLGDDNSTDGTREICIEYANKYPDKIKLFLHHRENNIQIDGLPTGRFNFAYNLYSASGKYIAICEGDDYWVDTKKLQKQVDFLESDSRYVICSHATMVHGQFSKDKIRSKIPDGNFASVLKNGLAQDTLSVVFKNKLSSFPEWLFKCAMGDYPLYLLLLEGGGNVKYLDGVMGSYRQHEGGMWSTLSKKDTGEKIVKTIELIDQGLDFQYHSLFVNAKKMFRRQFGLYVYSLGAVLKGETPLEFYLMRLRIETKKWLYARAHNSF